MGSQALAAQVERAAIPLAEGGEATAVLDLVGDEQVILLGEATHGTAEFYRIRAAISQQLLTERGFDAIAVEADWPDALRLSRFVRSTGSADRDAQQALEDFQRFPLWMWRNREIVALAEWLRAYNLSRRPGERAGFYGLDLYSLRASMDAVIRYLDQADPEAAGQARLRYGCFDHLAEDPQRYGYQAAFGELNNCEDQVVRQLVDLQQRTASAHAGEVPDGDELFYAQQNARVARNAEAYYRAMYRGRHSSWNLRDTHMADTVEALLQHLSARLGRPARVVAWAHNSHIGDARATEMGEDGEINLGQLMRERLGERNVFLLGFTTHSGAVSAASEWDHPVELKQVLPSRPDSIEHVLHDTGLRRLLLPTRGNSALQQSLSAERLLERAIGVIYLPETERVSHYFEADAGRQFDAVLHVDQTMALHPLDKSAYWQHTDQPETWPTGM